MRWCEQFYNEAMLSWRGSAMINAISFEAKESWLKGHSGRFI